MASITFAGRPALELREYKAYRIGSDITAKDLDFCIVDKSVAKFHATLTRAGPRLYLVNESRVGNVFVNGMGIGSVTLISIRNVINGVVRLRFGNVEAELRVSPNMTG
ncbi:uncharacterized protein LOC115626975 [Scaptodrosophila lebanonensis]|uniref:Uncharacterized protein LOC115626975 n=1 Tax=Drosophila lebanonensis TaxID=7225 RepID=A0A6J2TNZ6_DROLE|nr:uncharacterized protein LOC115626975 [Scaptodrosophila lebanonensis]